MNDTKESIRICGILAAFFILMKNCIINSERIHEKPIKILTGIKVDDGKEGGI